MNNFEQQVEDLIRDTSFIMYCQKKDDRETAVWETRLLTQPALLPVVKEAKNRVRLMTAGLVQAEMESGLARLKTSLEDLKHDEIQPAPVRNMGIIKRWWMAAAAIIVVAAMGWLAYQYTGKQTLSEAGLSSNGKLIIVPAGEHKSMYLPDGSLVILNGGSRLELSNQFNTTQRELTLTGEAYFDVKQDALKPFIIHTRAMLVKVLGTALNVRSYPDEPADATSLIRGKVEVSLIDPQKKQTGKYILEPMQKLIVEITTGTKSDESITMQDNPEQKIHLDSLVKNSLVNGFAETAWTEHNLVFNDETLEQVALKMEKWFGKKVVFENDVLRKMKYTGTFENDDLEKVLRIMKLSIPVLQYRIEKNNVILY